MEKSTGRDDVVQARTANLPAEIVPATPVENVPSRQISKDASGNTYPEGGLRAWLVVYGAFSGMTASFGLMNSIGTFEAYLSTHQLKDRPPATIGWIFSLYTFLSFFLGIQIGPWFDAKGPRALVLLGSLFLVGGTLGVAQSTGRSIMVRGMCKHVILI